MTVTIFHNPRCSKSRETLALLEAHDIEPTVIEYLQNPPSKSELKKIIHMLGLSSAREIMRKNEDEYKALNLADESLSESQLIDAMIANPRLIERPIVVKEGKAAIGRPPESVLAIL